MSSIATMIGRRIFLSFFILTLTSLIVFLGTEVLPGDALTATIPADEMAFYTEDQLAQMRAELGLDRSIPVRFFEVWHQLVTFDFGKTMVKREPVIDHIYHPMLNSAIMAGIALVVMLIIVVTLGVLASLRSGKWLDTSITGATLFTYSMPDFVISNVFVIVFAVWLGIVPAVILHLPMPRR